MSRRLPEWPGYGAAEAPSSPLKDRLQEWGVVEGVDQTYALSLFRQYKRVQAGEALLLRIGNNFFPSALLTETDRKTTLGVVDYNSEVRGSDRYKAVAGQTMVVLHPLDAGLGSRVSRMTYLESIWEEIGRAGPPRLGAKGTDLHMAVVLPGISALGEQQQIPVLVSTTEIKINRLLQQADNYAGVVFRPVVNNDSLPHVDRFLNSFYVGDRLDKSEEAPKRSYRMVLETNPKTVIGEFIVQVDLPTIDIATGELTNERRVPGGHGAIGYLVLQEIAETEYDLERPPVVRAIYNGDGPNNFPTPEMVGFAVAERAGVLIVSTTKLGIDLKGGLLGVETIDIEGQTVQVAQICEIAQAKKVGQENMFYAMGLSSSDLPEDLQASHTEGKQYFNTNMVLLNEDLLIPLLQGLREILGKEAFQEAISPDLIDNTVGTQNGKQYIQLEGALASAVLRLARVVATNSKAHDMWQRLSGGRPFLRLINLDPTQRDLAFTPTKFASDFLLQTATDQYKFNTETWQLENTTPGHLPQFGEEWVQDPFYIDVHNILDTLGGISVINLESLDIAGRIAMREAILKGIVRVVSTYEGVFDLNSKDSRAQLGQEKNKRLVLENVEVFIDENGHITVSPLDYSS